MRTSAYLAGVIAFSVAAIFQASPAHAAIDCNACQARYSNCLVLGNDDNYCLTVVGSACVRQCALVSADKHQGLLDPKVKSFAMSQGKSTVSLLEPKTP